MIETIILAIVAAAPSLVAIGSIIAAVCKLVKGFNELKSEVVKTKEYDEVKKELAVAHAENRELKKKLNELLTAIDRIKREE